MFLFKNPRNSLNGGFLRFILEDFFWKMTADEWELFSVKLLLIKYFVVKGEVFQFKTFSLLKMKWGINVFFFLLQDSETIEESFVAKERKEKFV